MQDNVEYGCRGRSGCLVATPDLTASHDNAAFSSWDELTLRRGSMKLRGAKLTSPSTPPFSWPWPGVQ